MSISLALLALMVFVAVPFGIEARLGPTYPKKFLEKNRKNLNRRQTIFLVNYNLVRILSGIFCYICTMVLVLGFRDFSIFGKSLAIFLLIASISLCAFIINWPTWIKARTN